MGKVVEVDFENYNIINDKQQSENVSKRNRKQFHTIKYLWANWTLAYVYVSSKSFIVDFHANVQVFEECITESKHVLNVNASRYSIHGTFDSLALVFFRIDLSEFYWTEKWQKIFIQTDHDVLVETVKWWFSFELYHRNSGR